MSRLLTRNSITASSSHETPAENGFSASVAHEPSTRGPAVLGFPVDLIPSHEAAVQDQLDYRCDSDPSAMKRKRVEKPVEADVNQPSNEPNSFDIGRIDHCMPSLGNPGYNHFPRSAQPVLHYQAPVSTASPTLVPSKTCLSQRREMQFSVLCNPPPQPASRFPDQFDSQQPVLSPRSSSQELTLIFKSLSPQHQDVLRLLFYAGSSAPESLFTGTCIEWDTTGNIHAFSHGICKQLDDGGEKILHDLETKRLVWTTKDCNRIYHINPSVVPALRQEMSSEIDWKRWVVDTVIHTFPTDRYKDPTK